MGVRTRVTLLRSHAEAEMDPSKDNGNSQPCSQAAAEKTERKVERRKRKHSKRRRQNEKG